MIKHNDTTIFYSTTSPLCLHHPCSQKNLPPMQPYMPYHNFPLHFSAFIAVVLPLSPIALIYLKSLPEWDSFEEGVDAMNSNRVKNGKKKEEDEATSTATGTMSAMMKMTKCFPLLFTLSSTMTIWNNAQQECIDAVFRSNIFHLNYYDDDGRDGSNGNGNFNGRGRFNHDNSKIIISALDITSAIFLSRPHLHHHHCPTIVVTSIVGLSASSEKAKLFPFLLSSHSFLLFQHQDFQSSLFLVSLIMFDSVIKVILMSRLAAGFCQHANPQKSKKRNVTYHFSLVLFYFQTIHLLILKIML